MDLSALRISESGSGGPNYPTAKTKHIKRTFRDRINSSGISAPAYYVLIEILRNAIPVSRTLTR